MIPSKQIYFLGWVTLLIFPLPAIGALLYFEDESLSTIFGLNDFFQIENLLGLAWGIIYAFILLAVGQIPFFSKEMEQQNETLSELKLSWIGIIFLSFCAGFGEEILFRAGIQHWLGISLTTILFIAIHGYLNPKKRIFFLGLILFPFIFSLGYFYSSLGLWFCIAAHFSYDLTLFSAAKYLQITPKNESN